MKRFLFLSLFIITQTGFSQTFKITGIIKDDKNTLPGASVVLLSPKDSTLETFTLSSPDGKYVLKNVKSGNYILQASFVGYIPVFKTVNITSDLDLDILLKAKSNQLKEVAVESDYVPIKIKNDTVEYNAKAFKTQPNASVEELLKKLPGVEVDKDGSIKAHGKSVNKVLVDGKEFFGDDPKMATKNLPADAINAVQVFDKKSDLTEFTGIDDGERERTINLKLKDDKKKGGFGTLSGGYGTNNRYESKVNFNKFRKNTQLSFVGNSNNINQQPFSVMDYVNFMGGLQNMMSQGGGRLSLSSEDLGMPLNYGNNEGLNQVISAGFNLNHDWGSKTDLRSSYFYNRSSKELNKELFRINNIGTGSYNNTDTSERNGTNDNHRFNLIFKHRPDSTIRIVSRSSFSLNNEESNSNSRSYSFLPEGDLKSYSNRSYKTDIDAYRFNSTLTFIKKLRKAGRNLATDLNYSLRNGLNTSTLNALNNYFTAGIPVIENINQEQNRKDNNLTYGTKLSFTEPLGNREFLELNYNFQRSDADQNKEFKNLKGQGFSETADSTNQYNSTFQYHRIGSNFKYVGKKQNITAGIAYQYSNLEGTLTGGTKVSKDFRNFLPKAVWTNNITSMKRLEMNYNTNINQPGIEQLQPVVNNSDPLNLTFGNPELNAEYAHNLNLSYNSFDQFSFVSLFASVYGTYTLNKITYSRTITPDLVQILKPINIDHDLTLGSYGSFGAPLKIIGAKFNTNANISYSKSIVWVNNQEDNTGRWTNSIQLVIENKKKDHFDLQVGTRYTFNVVKYDLNTSLNQSFINKNYFGDLSFFLPLNFTLNTSLDYYVYPSNQSFAAQNFPLWRGSVSKVLTKDKKLELKLSVFDILNQNIRINRTSNYNYIQTETTKSLGRYFMLTLTYSPKSFGSQGMFKMGRMR